MRAIASLLERCPDERLALIARPHHEHRRRGRARKQLRVGDPHERRTVDDDQIENLRAKRDQGEDPVAAQKIGCIRGQRPGGHEGEIGIVGFLNQLGRHRVAGKIVAEAA